MVVINDKMKIYSIQEEFNAAYPYLRLGFCSKPKCVTGASFYNLMENKNKTLGEIRRTNSLRGIIILPTMSVADLERGFKEVYGLNVLLYRKSGKAWLETSVTDSWSIEEQNMQGEALSKLAC